MQTIEMQYVVLVLVLELYSSTVLNYLIILVLVLEVYV